MTWQLRRRTENYNCLPTDTEVNTLSEKLGQFLCAETNPLAYSSVGGVPFEKALFHLYPNKPCILVLDETDALLAVRVGRPALTSLQALARLCMLWRATAQVARNGHLVLFAGNSPAFFSIGRSIFKGTPIGSPESHVFRVKMLSTMSETELAGWIQSVAARNPVMAHWLQLQTKDVVVNGVRRLSGGVPRLAYFVISWMLVNTPTNEVGNDPYSPPWVTDCLQALVGQVHETYIFDNIRLYSRLPDCLLVCAALNRPPLSLVLSSHFLLSSFHLCSMGRKCVVLADLLTLFFDRNCTSRLFICLFTVLRLLEKHRRNRSP